MSTVTGAALVVSGLLGIGTNQASARTAAPYSLTIASEASHSVVARWAPCVRTSNGNKPQYITYKVHPGAVQGRIALVKKAVRRLHRDTGLRFSYRGRTHYIPQQGKINGYQQLLAGQQEQRTGVKMVVAWASPGTGHGRSNLISNSLAGVGSIVWRYSSYSDLRISDAAVVLKRHDNLRHGFGRGQSEGTLLLHELGHAVGLQHVYDSSQVMNPTITTASPPDYAAGDRTGLRLVGANAGCMRGPWIPAS